MFYRSHALKISSLFLLGGVLGLSHCTAATVPAKTPTAVAPHDSLTHTSENPEQKTPVSDQNLFIENLKETEEELATEVTATEPSLTADERNAKAEVDLWQWGARAAVSYTLDEGVEEPYLFLLPELERRGWKASFFIYTRQPAPAEAWDDILRAYRLGHEVSNHTLTHPDMTTVSDEELVVEMETAINDLHNLGITRPMYSFAYPYESTNDRVWNIVKQYHRYARAGDHGVQVPPNPVPINDARHPDFGALTAKANTRNFSVAQWNSWIDATYESGGWFIEEWHGVAQGERKGGWEPRTMDEFNAHFDHIETFGDGLMIAPMGIVGNYIESRESARLDVDTWSESNIQLTLSDAFEFTVPLTFTLKLPESWDIDEVMALQKGGALITRKVDAHTLRIAAVPNANHPITLNKP